MNKDEFTKAIIGIANCGWGRDGIYEDEIISEVEELYKKYIIDIKPNPDYVEPPVVERQPFVKTRNVKIPYWPIKCK